MTEQRDIKEFPDLSNKLSAPSKKSLFEKQKAEAEAKRIREAAETAAVYEDFVKSFEDEENDTQSGFGDTDRPRGAPAGPSGPRFSSVPPKRHFAPGNIRGSSGPGSLGPAQPSRKRPLDGSRSFEREKERGIFAYDEPAPVDTAAVFRVSDDEEDKAGAGRAAERAAPKPTLQLSSLPPGTSPAVIKSLLPPNLTVDAVRIVPPSGPGSAGSTERKSMSAIVTLAKDTPASDIDTTVNTLQNKYLGWGFHLSLSRHLSSVALGSTVSGGSNLQSSLNSLPFGARPVPQPLGASLSRAPPPGMHRGAFAPPSSYTPSVPARGAPPVQVTVVPPSDIKQLKLIHKTVENLITHGPEFEALLMSRAEVQRDERWAWLWDSRSAGGIWYRWRIWDILTGANSAKSRGNRFNNLKHRLFQGGAPWLQPEEDLPFEFTTHLEGFVSDSEYNSSSEEDSADEGGPRKRRRQFEAAGGPPVDGSVTVPSDEQSYLNPLQKAKLTHLLARLPTSTGKLRKGDVARITSFAISHAGAGADEVVDMLIANVLQPFSTSRTANPTSKHSSDDDLDDPDTHTDNAPTPDKEKQDTSPSSLIALHLISDILSASSTSGVRHAWRYRSLFETALTRAHIFARLGRMEKEFGWGRLRAEKWKRSVGGVLVLWEGWCVFPAKTQEGFVEELRQPPLTREEEMGEEERTRREREREVGKGVGRSKWKSVEGKEEAGAKDEGEGGAEDMDVDGAPMEEADVDVDGEPMGEGVDGEVMDQEELDGEPMDDGLDGEPMDDEGNLDGSSRLESGPVEDGSSAAKRKPRPKAEDMFADSDDD